MVNVEKLNEVTCGRDQKEGNGKGGLVVGVEAANLPYAVICKCWEGDAVRTKLLAGGKAWQTANECRLLSQAAPFSTPDRSRSESAARTIFSAARPSCLFASS